MGRYGDLIISESFTGDHILFFFFFLRNAGIELGFNYHWHLFAIGNRLLKKWEEFTPKGELKNTLKDYSSRNAI